VLFESPCPMRTMTSKRRPDVRFRDAVRARVSTRAHLNALCPSAIARPNVWANDLSLESSLIGVPREEVVVLSGGALVLSRFANEGAILMGIDDRSCVFARHASRFVQ
jgi:hypothetical protein